MVLRPKLSFNWFVPLIVATMLLASFIAYQPPEPFLSTSAPQQKATMALSPSTSDFDMADTALHTDETCNLDSPRKENEMPGTSQM